MAFTRVEKLRTGGHGAIMPQVTMGAYLADGKKHKSKQINFRVTRALINELGWEPDNDKLYIAINEGSGSDKGFLQLVPDKMGRRTTVEADTNQGMAINATLDSFKHYVLNECPMPTEVVNHIVDGNALIIECPDWFRFNPLSEPQPEPEPEKVTQLNREQRRAVAARVARSLKR
jgi:hypothetical protein